MKQIADYQGGLLNHLNLSYRAGDRDLAVELMKAIGLTVMVTEFTDMSLISAHPNVVLGVFMDGHTQTVTKNAPAPIVKRLVTRDDGQQVPSET